MKETMQKKVDMKNAREGILLQSLNQALQEVLLALNHAVTIENRLAVYSELRRRSSEADGQKTQKPG